jgi:hypothetical protein
MPNANDKHTLPHLRKTKIGRIENLRPDLVSQCLREFLKTIQDQPSTHTEKAGNILHKENLCAHSRCHADKLQNQIIPGIFVIANSLDGKSLTGRSTGN